jgi:hypothetical protein
VTVPLSFVFEHPVLTDFAAALEGLLAAADDPAADEPAADEPVAPHRGAATWPSPRDGASGIAAG